MKNIKIVTLLCSLLFVENFYADNNDFAERNNDSDDLGGLVFDICTAKEGCMDNIDDDFIAFLSKLLSIVFESNEDSVSVKNEKFKEKFLQMMIKMKGEPIKLSMPLIRLTFRGPNEVIQNFEFLQHGNNNTRP